MTRPLLVAAVALDSLTLLLMGTAYEANPLVRGLGVGPALGIRWSAVLVLVAIAPHLRHPRPFLMAGTGAGLVGALSNLLVVL